MSLGVARPGSLLPAGGSDSVDLLPPWSFVNVRTMG